MPDYPILQQNKPIGTLTRDARGAVHGVFRAGERRTPTGCGSPCGERSRAYLGLMLPDGSGWLTLTQSGSRGSSARVCRSRSCLRRTRHGTFRRRAEPAPDPAGAKAAPDDGLTCSGIPRRTACSPRLTASGWSLPSRRIRRTFRRAARRPCCARSTAGRTSFFHAELQFCCRRAILVAKKCKGAYRDENERFDREKNATGRPSRRRRSAM